MLQEGRDAVRRDESEGPLSRSRGFSVEKGGAPPPGGRSHARSQRERDGHCQKIHRGTSDVTPTLPEPISGF